MKKAKFNLDIYDKEFITHINNKEEYNYYQGLRDKIKDTYIEKIKNNQLDINVENLRLNSLSNKFRSPLRSESMGVVMVIMSIVASGFINLIAQFSSFCITIIFTIACALTIILTYFKTYKKEPSKFFLYPLCLEILNEIKKESLKIK